MEHVARADQVDPAALARAAHDHERKVHHHVHVRQHPRHSFAVAHVALLVGHLLPARGGRVEGFARHAHDSRHITRALERAHHRAPHLPRRAGDRHGEAGGAAATRRHPPWTVVKLNNGKPNSGDYGFGWEITNSHGHRVVGHSGSWQGFKTQLSRYVDDKLTVVVLANLAEANPGKIAEHVAELYLAGH